MKVTDLRGDLKEKEGGASLGLLGKKRNVMTEINRIGNRMYNTTHTNEMSFLCFLYWFGQC